MIRRFATGVALATGLALSLTGCLGEAGTKVDEAGKNLKLSAAQVLDKTAEKTGRVDSLNTDMTITYHDFGKPVDITAPPAGQVTDFSEMLNALGGGGS
ncbi:hypothetical protein [Spirillospora sp. NPDC048823]|uniref:hypothetical protein n=1 Tax=unclassified Spirillospora TaxID=2642701 RepID=UPI00370FD3F4